MKKPVKKVIRPVRIQIPNTLFDPSTEGQEHTICLFCRSEDKTSIETELSSNPFPGLTKVMSLDDVKKYLKQYQDRKKLLKEHTHFLCDTRIFSHIINLLGKVFSHRNNYPIPIDISTINKLQSAVNRSINQSTYMN